MPAALLILALSAFAIGTTEYAILGLLPQIATDLAISIPRAGWIVTGYALGVALGAPVMAYLTARLPRRRALIMLMGVFIAGNILCAIATGYEMLMVARVLTALSHAAFFGIGSVVASRVVGPERSASAIALMFTGLTLANVLGVPAGTALGQWLGWRIPFWIVAGLGVFSLIGLIRILPHEETYPEIHFSQELAAFRHVSLWLALITTVLFSASLFALFTYIAPLLGDVTGLSPHGVAWTLVLIGCGLTLGNLLGGWLADWRITPTIMGVFIAMAITSTLFYWTSNHVWLAEITLFLWATVSFAGIPPLQLNIMRLADEAPNLVSTLNQGAFNAGNAVGAWVGGNVIAAGLGMTHVTFAAAIVALIGLATCILAVYVFRQRPQTSVANAKLPSQVT